MKRILAIITLSMSLQAHASITLTPIDSSNLLLQLSIKTQPLGIDQIKIDKGQSFDIIENGKYLSTLIPAEGYYRKYNPLCFIGWSIDKKEISNIVPSIGQGDFENSTCLSLDAVGKIDVSDKTYIGFVYTVGLRDRRAKNYFLLELGKNKRTIVDKSTVIDELQNNGEKKSIFALRKYLENTKEKKE
ncbi:hypothetical protein [Dickeya solani]|uniref:Uncharacterized protein n=1 Tax=Dickeya solani TaxID=1089444 RepID=A0ABU4EHV7_9GAMM|nr:hypothetical protein [Dickeya solani]MCA7000367.1 hypothetical protein [Dickeya solani]MCZ0822899.1 hypothetical protein [Dickeya solani]MDV6995205.1 hypothetical protein [Dickeya solani]MDV7004678.1 hypothetical protein [Dickeya solani]MDV7037789.1 hypothetical protein [Dickeya solani]